MLTDKQEKFCHAYIVDFNATQAAITAGYSKKTAYSMGPRLLKNVEIQKRLSELSSPILEKLDISAERTIAEMAKVAYSNIGDIVEIKGGKVIFKDSDKYDPSIISEIVMTEYGLKMKFHDKMKGLDQLARTQGLYRDKTELSGEITINVDLDDAEDDEDDDADL